MSRLKLKRVALLAVVWMGFVLCFPVMVHSQDQGVDYQIPDGVYIKLTKDFYEALKNQSSKVYTNNPSEEYLKQIAVATKFMVETNLEILKQQGKLNEMLRSILKDRKK